MTHANFSSIEQRINRAVERALSNVQATWNGGETVLGIFENPYESGDVGGMGMASAAPSLSLLTAHVPPRVVDWFRYFNEAFGPVDLNMAIGNDEYLVVAHEPDGAGRSVLRLEKVG